MRTHIDGTLDYTQNKRHIAHAFSVPPGTTRLTIHFDYSPKQSQEQAVRNDLSLTVFDPLSCRGARHNNQDRDLTITARSATPGYLPGIEPGAWTAWIDTHRVLPPDTIHYTFDIETSSDPIVENDLSWTAGTTAPRGQGWYRGDLHGHTLHSDGRWDVPDLIQYARDYGLDFVTLSDHNTVSGLRQFDSLRSDDLLTIGGMEMTTYYGHALALGLREWVEWRIGVDGLTMPELADRARQAGATFIIAHPLSVGDPYCTGCDWGYADMLPGNARIVEIWNSAWETDGHNERALQLWYRWLNAGYRMTATRGSDIHEPLNYTNVAFNVVYADELSEEAILRAIRQGHLYISAGPRLDLTARDSDGGAVMVGDRVTSDRAEVALAWEACSVGEHLRLIVDGVALEEIPVEERGSRTWVLSHTARWCVVEIRRADGELRAVTNPLYLAKFVEQA